MKKTLALIVVLGSAALAFAQAPEAKPSANPVADAVRAMVARQAKNLIASAEEMPADKYDFHPTPAQMTFAHLMAHIAGSNRFMCSSIAGQERPKPGGITEKDGKDKLVQDVKDSFDYCESALKNVDDSKLTEEIPFFGGKQSRAVVMVALPMDLADHYAMAAMYLRLNGMLPPTAKGKE